MMRSLSDMTANGLCRRALACLDQSDYRRLDQLLVDARRDSRLRKYVNDYPSLGVEISEAELGVMRQLFPATGAVPPNTEQVAIAEASTLSAFSRSKNSAFDNSTTGWDSNIDVCQKSMLVC
jgi:hypothetical protein